MAIVHQLLRHRVRQGAPNLEELQLEHPDERPGRSAGALVVRIKQPDDIDQLLPGHGFVHQLEESSEPCRFGTPSIFITSCNPQIIMPVSSNCAKVP